MKTQLSIQERLKDLRVEKGLTLEQLSQQTKIPASTLGSYESDDYKEIPHRNIFDLAKFYGVSADYLLGMTENRQLDNISISELHLSDDTLSLLKDQKSTHCSCQSLSPISSPLLPLSGRPACLRKKADRRIWRMMAIVRRFVFCRV